ncbi:MAG: zinc-ribbon domain-containing protein [Clostridiales bacterium]|nr:zinc-ribbon domain-containing protein [Clostridiales bacterium]
MFCKKCGNEIAENEKFCKKCGTPTQATDLVGAPTISTSAKGVTPVKMVGLAMVVLFLLQIIMLYTKTIHLGGNVSGFGMSYSDSQSYSLNEIVAADCVIVLILALVSIVFALGEAFEKIRKVIIGAIPQLLCIAFHFYAVTNVKKQIAEKIGGTDFSMFGVSASASFEINGFLTMIDILLLVLIVAMIFLNKKKA